MSRLKLLATLAVLLLPALAGCGGSTGFASGQIAEMPPAASPTARAGTSRPAPTAAAGQAAVRDFRIAAYQGADVLGGEQSRLSGVFAHGKPVVLNFWAPLCRPCVAEMPAFQRVAAEYEGRVIFVGIDVGSFAPEFDDQEEARRLLRDLRITYPAAYATENPLRLYNVTGVPTTVFFRADGTIVQQRTGGLSERQVRDGVRKLVD